MYLKSFINCANKAEALSKAGAMIGHFVIHENQDGTATINELSQEPAQVGQKEFISASGDHAMVNLSALGPDD